MVIAALWPPGAVFAQANCAYNNAPENLRSLEQPYQIIENTFEKITSLDFPSLREAIIRAGEQWNHQAVSGHFRYMGDVTHEFTNPPWQPSPPCNSIKRYVRVVDSSPQTGINCANGWARAFKMSHCSSEGWITGYFSHYMKDGTCQPIDWQASPLVMSDVQRAEEDAVNRMIHEFGHAIGLGHAPLDRASIMDQLGEDLPGALTQYHQRDLSRWDKTCTRPYPRRLGIHRHMQDAAFFPGHLWGSTQILSSHEVVRASPQYSPKAPGWVVLYGLTTTWDTTQRCWGLQNDIGSVSCSSLIWPGIGGTAATMAEDANTHDHVFLSTDEEYPNPSAYEWGDHRLRRGSSTAGFSSWPSTSFMNVCTSMSAWHTCSSQIQLTTARRAAVSRLFEPDIFIVAWSNQKRDPGNAQNPWLNRQVMVAAGRINQSTLPQPTPLPASGTASVTSVGPGVACDPGQAGGYDCIVVWADDAIETPNVIVSRFNIVQTSTRYQAQWEQTCVPVPPFGWCMWVPTRWHIGDRTAADIAAWRQSGRWWIGIRSMEPGQGIRVYRSDDGASWTLAQSFSASSAVGPEAIATKRSGQNQLIRVW